MALPKELVSDRLTLASLGTDIPAALAALEAALCDILGFTIDTNVTVSPFNCDNTGRLTKALILQKAAAPVGYRFLETTGGTEFRIANDGTYVSIDQNTGTEGTPVWTNRAKIATATGVVTFPQMPVAGPC